MQLFFFLLATLTDLLHFIHLKCDNIFWKFVEHSMNLNELESISSDIWILAKFKPKKLNTSVTLLLYCMLYASKQFKLFWVKMPRTEPFRNLMIKMLVNETNTVCCNCWVNNILQSHISHIDWLPVCNNNNSYDSFCRKCCLLNFFFLFFSLSNPSNKIIRAQIIGQFSCNFYC